MTTETLDRTACNALLAPHLPALEQCFRNAWDRWSAWLKVLEGSPADISARTRANIVYDFIVAEAKRLFQGTEDVRTRLERGFLIVHFNDRLALRFKKFRDKSLKTSGIRTRQAERFQQQALDFGDELQPLTHLVAGYLLDDLALDMDRLAITCTLDGAHLWAPIEMLDTSVGGKVQQISMHQPATPRPTVRSARKTRKGGDEE